MNKVAYEYLNGVRWSSLKIMRLIAEKNELESCLLPAAIRYDKDRVQSSPEDPMGKIVSQVMEKEEDIKEAMLEKAQRIKEISETIGKLDRPEEKTVLTLYFIERKRIKDIADMMDYSTDGVYGIRRKACDNIVRFIPQNQK
jgi:DNA-directed RNA polymerase specialized sigma subunit